MPQKQQAMEPLRELESDKGKLTAKINRHMSPYMHHICIDLIDCRSPSPYTFIQEFLVLVPQGIPLSLQRGRVFSS